ncbi:fluoride efflux transporter CrcB [Roseovarius sp. 2305UL8-3]|uniref:fluoride efflux transporter CrcB n=1 Tax=Roseovarius conchicola TaxID=3121636 RepID=UPI003527DEFC
MIMTFLQVGLGGAIGAMLRFGTGLALLRLTGAGFPLGVLGVNVVGSFLMGVFVVYALHRDLEHLSPFVMAGVLGGFTTFSAFSLETFALYEKGEIGQAALYVALSVILSIGALILGVFLARSAWA